MTRQQINAILCVILETLAESSHGVPSGHIYAALMTTGISLDSYQAILEIAQKGGLVVVEKSHLVTITPKGLDIVAKIKAAKQS